METAPLCLLVAITSIHTGGNLGREKLSGLRGGVSECSPTLQLWASVLSLVVAPTRTVPAFTLLAGGPFLSRSSRAGCLPSPLWHRGEPVWESWRHGMVWLEGLFKGVTLVGAVCPLSSLQLGRKAPFLPGIVIMACSAINIHREALLIAFLINSMHGTLGVDEECALVGTSSHVKSILPWQIHSWAHSLSSQPNHSPPRLTSTPMAVSCSMVGHPSTPV